MNSNLLNNYLIKHRPSRRNALCAARAAGAVNRSAARRTDHRIVGARATSVTRH
jgi:hypothetical protein